jgi:putative phosphoesterase
MKSLILSDIHSNIYALEAIWDREKDSDRIYCTGDLVDYGPFPLEVLNWVRDHQVVCTQGNHDSWLVKNFKSGNLMDKIPEEQRAWVHHNASLLSGDDIDYLNALPEAVRFQQGGVHYGMTHLYKGYDEIVSTHAFDGFLNCAVWEGGTNQITRLIFGHTHRQGVRYLSDELLWLNPGSVSYRRQDDPDQSAHYATITGSEISLKRVDYDLEPLNRCVQGITLSEFESQAARWFFGKR